MGFPWRSCSFLLERVPFSWTRSCSKSPRRDRRSGRRRCRGGTESHRDVLQSFVDRVSSASDANGHMENTVRTTVLALVITATATPVYAQVSPNLAGGSVKLKTDVEPKQEQDREAGYQAGVAKIP